jgi:hypothetical protein
MEYVHFQPSEIIFKRGDRHHNKTYILFKGKAAIYSESNQEVEIKPHPNALKNPGRRVGVKF